MENTIDNALLKVQKEISGVKKDKKNPFYNSAYFDINQLLQVVKPVLNKHGLVLYQPIKENIVYSVITDGNESIQSYLTLPNIEDPQKIGMAITYYRRYTLASLLSLEALDDDGNTTAGLGNKHKPTTAEVSALIKKGSKKQAREYWKKCDWTNSQELSNKLTSHFN